MKLHETDIISNTHQPGRSPLGRDEGRHRLCAWTQHGVPTYLPTHFSCRHSIPKERVRGIARALTPCPERPERYVTNLGAFHHLHPTIPGSERRSRSSPSCKCCSLIHRFRRSNFSPLTPTPHTCTHVHTRTRHFPGMHGGGGVAQTVPTRAKPRLSQTFTSPPTTHVPPPAGSSS